MLSSVGRTLRALHTRGLGHGALDPSEVVIAPDGAPLLVAAGLAPDCVGYCLAGHVSAEPGHARALAALGGTPLLDLGMRLGEGTGALLALPLVAGAARALQDVATFDAAGVVDKTEGSVSERTSVTAGLLAVTFRQGPTERSEGVR